MATKIAVYLTLLFGFTNSVTPTSPYPVGNPCFLCGYGPYTRVASYIYSLLWSGSRFGPRLVDVLDSADDLIILITTIVKHLTSGTPGDDPGDGDGDNGSGPGGPGDGGGGPNPTPTPGPGGGNKKHIALGRNEYLTDFFIRLWKVFAPLKIDVYIAANWHDAGLSDMEASVLDGSFPEAFGQAVNRAEQIHFNLQGIPDPNKYADERGGNGDLYIPGVYVTAWELYMIRDNAFACNKTVFYSDGITPSSRGSQVWENVCGQ